MQLCTTTACCSESSSLYPLHTELTPTPSSFIFTGTDYEQLSWPHTHKTHQNIFCWFFASFLKQQNTAFKSQGDKKGCQKSSSNLLRNALWYHWLCSIDITVTDPFRPRNCFSERVFLQYGLSLRNSRQLICSYCLLLGDGYLSG